ncbi:COG4705 family protein [Aliiglaciecola lipolytica]|nr:hypothetical protein [Aliiglaciecola lipolytica]
MTINRVPQIIILYWIIKIAATTLGETGADLFSMTLNLGYHFTILIFIGLFLVCLLFKLKQAKYAPTLYWITFTSSAIAGTAMSDFIDRTMGLGYLLGSTLLFILLIFTLIAWYQKEGSISVERVNTNSSEVFYWIAFLVANTLGTAVGDYMADDLSLGFIISAEILAGILILCAILHYVTRLSGLVLFWIAFVLTRPFGATFGDFLTKSHSQGGIELGTTSSASAIFLSILVLALVFEQVRVNKLAQSKSE